MKTLEQIIERGDYSRLTTQLKKRVQEIAKSIRYKMNELDIEELDDLSIRTIKSDRNGYSDDFLSVNGHDLESVNRSYYYCNDYNLYVKGATNKEALNFLNRVRDYLSYLDEIETEQANDIEKALNENKDILL